jgi:hypothetical protein
MEMRTARTSFFATVTAATGRSIGRVWPGATPLPTDSRLRPDPAVFAGAATRIPYRMGLQASCGGTIGGVDVPVVRSRGPVGAGALARLG